MGGADEDRCWCESSTCTLEANQEELRLRGQQEQAEEMCAEQLTRMERKIDEQNSAIAAKLDALLAAVQS